ncbi:hypothetical protein HO173_004232 [Letharia columbiana]|uniref:Uncharacterized protein n=1 Tax=Letharia columbiana TaxID=112416 RepID=A0A8H6FYW8_9LECA|nr:uncharacterized protein HO173_004232 [Letharia columbiana]KAF6237342.1 hypothetical protein HO173_004232 [Letharia columbiana]
MSWAQPRGGKEGRRQRGGEGLDSYCDCAMDRKIFRPSGGDLERRIDVPHRSELPPRTRPGYCLHGQQKLPLPPPQDSSLDWQEERRLPPRPNSSPGWQEKCRLPPPRRWSPGWYEERPLADSDTLPRHWRDAQLAKRDTRGTNQGQPTSKGARVHFQRPAECSQRTPEDEEEEEESGSSPGNSLRGSVAHIEEGEKSDDRDPGISDYFDMIEHEGAGSGDEDDYVYVPDGSPRGSPCGRCF